MSGEDTSDDKDIFIELLYDQEVTMAGIMGNI